jgi:hypothetical protein
LCDSIIVAIAVGLLGYYIRELKVYSALLFGLLSRYIVPIGLLLYSGAWTSSLFEEVTKGLDSGLYILITLQVLSTLYFSYLGLNFGKRTIMLILKTKTFITFAGYLRRFGSCYLSHIHLWLNFYPS